jgi:hypothetical protein
MANRYSGGTVWLQVVPSFNGLQGAIRQEVGKAFAGAGIDEATAKAFQPVEKRAEEAGRKAADKFAGSFQTLTRDRLKRVAKDVDTLKDALPEKEFRQIRAVINDIAKQDLTKVTGQAKAADGIRALRNQFQGMLDDNSRALSDPERWTLGAVRKQFDEIGDTIQKWSAPDPKAIQQQAELQKMGKLHSQALREDAQRELKAVQARGKELREQFKLAQNRSKLEKDNARAEQKAVEERGRELREVFKMVQNQAKLEKDSARAEQKAIAERGRELREQFKIVQNQVKLNKENAAAEERQIRERGKELREQFKLAQNRAKLADMAAKAAEREQAAVQKMGQIQERAIRENEARDRKIVVDGVKAEEKRIKDQIRILTVQVQMGADNREVNAKLAQLNGELDALEARKVEVDVDVDTLGARLQLQRLEAQTNKTGSIRGNLMGLLDAGAAANSVRVFNGVLTATLALGPLLIPALAAVAAGIFGIGAAAAGAVLGVGTLVAGLAGIGGAVEAMSELDRARREERSGAGRAKDAAAERRQAVQDARAVADAQRSLTRARRDAAESLRASNQRVADAERGLARAHTDAAEAAANAAERTQDARERLAQTNEQAALAAEQAARRVRDAERSLSDAQTGAREAQLRLNEARRQARRDLEDLNNALDSARLSEREAEFSLEEAAAHLNSVLEDDQATQRERDKAQLRYDQAKEALEQQQLETRRLETDTKKANKEGVEGSDRVQDAKQRIIDATRRVRDSEEALADARAAQARQELDNQREIADAREAVADAVRAQAEVEIENAQRVGDAERALQDARRDRALTQISASEAIADAERNLARTHQDIALRGEEAAAATGALATAQDNLAEALRNLSPAGIAFAEWLYSLSPLLRELRFTAQEGLLPGLQDGLQEIVDTYGPSFIDFVGELSTVIGDLSREFGSLLANDPIWQSFFATIADFGPTFLRQFGEVTINLLTAFAAIMTAFSPFIAEMGEGLVGLTADFADWAAGLEDSPALQSFFEYLRDAGPEIGILLDNLFEILKDLFIGLAPYADQLLDSLIGFTDWLAEMDPDEIANLALGIGALVLSIQLLAGALSVISGVGGLIGGALKFGGAAGSAVKSVFGAAANKTTAKLATGGAAGAAGAAIDGVGVAAGATGKRLVGLLGPVGLAISILWLLWDAASWLDDEFNLLGGTTDDVTKGIGDAWDWMWTEILKPVWDIIMGVLNVFGQMFETLGNIIYQVIRYVIAPIVNWLWDHTFGPAWEEHIQPMLEDFGDWVERKLPTAIQAGVDLIENIWQGLLNIFRAPIRAAIDIVWNKGLIGSFNWLADKVPGMERIDPIDIPASLYPNGKKFADGGVMPGYTPGRDVHTFFSPTAGLLELSGGEPILRPEAGQVLGHDWVHGVNAAARTGGTAGVARFLGVRHEAHADGGFFGDIVDKISGGLSGIFSNPLGFFDKALDSALDQWGVGGLYGDMVGPMLKSVPRSIADWIGDLIFGGDAAPSGGAPAGAMGWQMMWSIVKNQFPGAALHSAFRPGAITAVGTPSYHGLGRAIDITPSMEIFDWLARTFSNATELIFSPAGRRQLWNGQNYLFGEPTRGDHWDHIHWAMATGGILPTLYDDGGDVPPGLTLVANASGRKESIVTDGFMEEVRALGARAAARGAEAPVVDARGANFGYDPAEVAERLDTLRRDRMALTGVFTENGV